MAPALDPAQLLSGAECALDVFDVGGGGVAFPNSALRCWFSASNRCTAAINSLTSATSSTWDSSAMGSVVGSVLTSGRIAWPLSPGESLRWNDKNSVSNYEIETETRKLAAIMFTDIVGFSRQMGADEGLRRAATLRDSR